MILTAFPVGFFAGLFGIGGGLITVPFLFFIFETLNIDKSYIMHLAVGTSFSIIVPTALSSVLTHKKNNYVDLNIIKKPPTYRRGFYSYRAESTRFELVHDYYTMTD